VTAPAFLKTLTRPLKAVLALVAATLWGCAQTPSPQRPQAPGEGPAPAPRPSVAPATSWDQYRARAAQRIASINHDRVYTDPTPDVLLAIPVLEIELNADGSVRRIDVLRHPGQARDTTQVAIDAVRRAAPFGDVRRLPRPWRFTETFLFRDDRRFKLRTLD
jgi:hypothetical protein